MLILGLDCETTGLDPEKDKMTELGMVLYDTEAKMPLKIYCEYIKIEGEVPEFITDLTGITKQHLDDYGVPLDAAIEEYLVYSVMAEYQVAHNAPFDRGFINAAIASLKLSGIPNENDTPWIDTSVDVPYPKKITTRKLEFLGPAHGFINPWSHRALFDVLSMLKVLDHYDINKVVRLAGEGDSMLVAICQKPWLDKAPDGQKDTDTARELGFRWNGDKKRWQKIVKESQVEQELIRANGVIKVQILEE